MPPLHLSMVNTSYCVLLILKHDLQLCGVLEPSCSFCRFESSTRALSLQHVPRGLAQVMPLCLGWYPQSLLKNFITS